MPAPDGAIEGGALSHGVAARHTGVLAAERDVIEIALNLKGMPREQARGRSVQIRLGGPIAGGGGAARPRPMATLLYANVSAGCAMNGSANPMLANAGKSAAAPTPAKAQG